VSRKSLITSPHFCPTSRPLLVNKFLDRYGGLLPRTINPDALFLVKNRLRLIHGNDQLGPVAAEFEPVPGAQT
jgi:hypothetical protein